MMMLHGPKKTKVNFHATHMWCHTKQQQQQQQLSSCNMVANCCGSCRMLHAALVVAIIEAQRCCCCCNICRQFFVVSVSRLCQKHVPLPPTCVARCVPHPSPPTSCCLFYACLMSCRQIYCHKLMQVDRNRKTEWKVKMRVTVTVSLLLSLSLALPIVC